MRRTLLACGLLAAAACGTTLPPSSAGLPPASVPTADPDLPSADAILARHIEATGLRVVLEGSQSVHVRGAVEHAALDLVGEFDAWRARPARSAMRLWLPTLGETSYGCDGRRAWTLQPMVGPQVLAGADLLKACAGAVYDHLLRRPQGLETLVTVARRRFEGKECYEVYGLYADPAGSDPVLRSFREFYDVSSGLLVGIVERSGSSTGNANVTRVFSDYAPLGGSLVARRTVQRSPGLTLVFTVEEVSYDAVSDEEFEVPQVAAALLPP